MILAVGCDGRESLKTMSTDVSLMWDRGSVFSVFLRCCKDAVRGNPLDRIPQNGVSVSYKPGVWRLTGARHPLSPDNSRCVGVDMEKACLIELLFHVFGFDRSPRT
jgi:hypothetical protein